MTYEQFITVNVIQIRLELIINFLLTCYTWCVVLVGHM